jgi:hypothetical protein
LVINIAIGRIELAEHAHCLRTAAIRAPIVEAPYATMQQLPEKGKSLFVSSQTMMYPAKTSLKGRKEEFFKCIHSGI